MNWFTRTKLGLLILLAVTPFAAFWGLIAVAVESWRRDWWPELMDSPRTFKKVWNRADGWY